MSRETNNILLMFKLARRTGLAEQGRPGLWCQGSHLSDSKTAEHGHRARTGPATADTSSFFIAEGRPATSQSNSGRKTTMLLCFKTEVRKISPVGDFDKASC